VVACELFGTPLAPADGDRYVTEMAVAAELVGIPSALVPLDLAGLRQYLSSVRNELRCTPAAADAAAFLLDPPGLDPDIAEIWQDIRDGATAAMPEWALQMYGYHPPGAPTPARRAEIRQALGVLDVVFLGEPGVLEARQRIALRMRAAQRA
jgi:uncharacterized protein (DUF2236 family)